MMAYIEQLYTRAHFVGFSISGPGSAATDPNISTCGCDGVAEPRQGPGVHRKCRRRTPYCSDRAGWTLAKIVDSMSYALSGLIVLASTWSTVPCPP